MEKVIAVAAIAAACMALEGCRYLTPDTEDPFPECCANERALEDGAFSGCLIRNPSDADFTGAHPHPEFVATSHDHDGDAAFSVAICNVTPRLRFALRPAGGFRYCAKFVDGNDDICVFRTVRNDADFGVSIVLADFSKTNSAWVSSFYYCVLKFPFRYKRILDLTIELDYADFSVLGSAASIQDIRARCKTVRLPVEISGQE